MEEGTNTSPDRGVKAKRKVSRAEVKMIIGAGPFPLALRRRISFKDPFIRRLEQALGRPESAGSLMNWAFYHTGLELGKSFLAVLNFPHSQWKLKTGACLFVEELLSLKEDHLTPDGACETAKWFVLALNRLTQLSGRANHRYIYSLSKAAADSSFSIMKLLVKTYDIDTKKMLWRHLHNFMSFIREARDQNNTRDIYAKGLNHGLWLLQHYLLPAYMTDEQQENNEILWQIWNDYTRLLDRNPDEILPSLNTLLEVSEMEEKHRLTCVAIILGKADFLGELLEKYLHKLLPYLFDQLGSDCERSLQLTMELLDLVFSELPSEVPGFVSMLVESLSGSNITTEKASVYVAKMILRHPEPNVTLLLELLESDNTLSQDNILRIVIVLIRIVMNGPTHVRKQLYTDVLSSLVETMLLPVHTVSVGVQKLFPCAMIAFMPNPGWHELEKVATIHFCSRFHQSLQSRIIPFLVNAIQGEESSAIRVNMENLLWRAVEKLNNVDLKPYSLDLLRISGLALENHENPMERSAGAVLLHSILLNRSCWEVLNFSRSRVRESLMQCRSLDMTQGLDSNVEHVSEVLLKLLNDIPAI